MRTPYKNLSGVSGILAYKYDQSSITVKFSGSGYTMYLYTYQSASPSVIEHMKGLADAGKGLNSYISTHKPGYASRQ